MIFNGPITSNPRAMPVRPRSVSREMPRRATSARQVPSATPVAASSNGSISYLQNRSVRIWCAALHPTRIPSPSQASLLRHDASRTLCYHRTNNQ